MAPLDPPPRPTIVVADDQPGMLELCTQVLSVVSDRAVTARDGDAAWEAIRAHRPRVAVLDADMPGLTGYEVAALVRADPELAGVRVLLVTGHDAEDEAGAAGAHRWLAKPFRPSALLDAVRDLAAG